MTLALHRSCFGVVVLGVLAVSPLRPAPVGPRNEPPALQAAQHGPDPWRREWTFERSTHVSVIRARFASTTAGVPIRYRWEIKRCDGEEFLPIEDTSEHRDDPAGLLVLPRRRSWFVDAEGCGLRLSVTGTNAGTPAIERVDVLEGARDVLHAASASDDPRHALTDGRYETAWTGQPGRGRWTITLALPRAERIDRARLVLGSTATSVARAGLGRNYAVARAPQRWSLAVSEDGTTYTTVARGESPLVRRPMIEIAHPRPVTSLKLVMEGSTDDAGQPSMASSPVVREISAYAADDAHAVLVEPWILSVNANPAASARKGAGGEVANDAYFAKFLQMRFASLHNGVARDDHYARRLGSSGELLAADDAASDGRALESIEGDDPALTEGFLTASWPPPIAVLSGSNDWEYARRTAPNTSGTTKWNPLLPARDGGMGALATAVKHRAVPFVGFCGGAQILALLEARTDGSGAEIDAILRRNTGRPIRGFAPASSLIRAWPGEGRPAPRVVFDKNDSLFADLASASGRSTTHAFPQSHLDLVRPEAFLDSAPLARLRIVATSQFCSPAVVASLHAPSVEKNPAGVGRCARVTEVFRSRDGAWPIIGAQFHAEQRDFPAPLAGDPPEAVADARMFVAATYEEIVDAYLRRQ
jgi:hypothetical protein